MLTFSIHKKGLFLILAAFAMYVNMHTGFVSRFFAILAPFFIGAVIAYFLSRPILKVQALFEKSQASFVKRKSHIFAVILVFSLLILVVGIIIRIFAPIIISNIMDLIGNLEIYYEDALTWLNNLESDHFLYSFLPGTDIRSSTELLHVIPSGNGDQGVLNFITNSLTTVVINIVNVTTSVIHFAMGIIIAFYLLLYKTSVFGLINRIATALLKPDTLDFAKSYINKSNKIFYRFISAQFLDACILGTLATILLLFLRVEYAVTFGVLLGFFNMIPFFGSIIATLVTVAVTFFTGGLQQAFITFAALLILQQIDANFINPKITGDSLGMNPLLIVTSIFIGGAYMGVMGMFIGVPIAAILKSFLEDLLVYREDKLRMKETSHS